MTNVKPLIVIACASEDEETVSSLYGKLENADYRPWMAKFDLKEGEEWEEKILEIMREADVLLLCLSNNSCTKEGFFQREIKEAIDLYEEKTPGSIFLMPVRLEKCKVPEIKVGTAKLTDFQRVDLFERGGFKQLLSAIEKGLKEVKNFKRKREDVTILYSFTIYLEPSFSLKDLVKLGEGEISEIPAFKSIPKERLVYLRKELLKRIVLSWVGENLYERVRRENIEGIVIDVVGLHKKKVGVFECKIDVQEDNELLIRRINGNAEKVRNKYPEMEIEKFLMVYERVEERSKILFKTEAIQVIDNFKKILEKKNIFRLSKNVLDYLLGLEITNR